MGSKNRAEILLVGTEMEVLESLYEELRIRDYVVSRAIRAEEAVSKASQLKFDLVIMELAPDLSGLRLLKHLHLAEPSLPIILISEVATSEAAISATRLGARDFLVEPIRVCDLLAIINNAVSSGAPRLLPLQAGEAEFGTSGLIGTSSVMQALYKRIGLAADSRATVLIHGATGTGKELVARAIHQYSDRAAQPFIAVNCNAITETLFESELFGHEGGAFTGARGTRIGCFERAQYGSVFLDEIGDLSSGLQVKLLRVLQERTIQRIGGRQEISLDIRCIAATHRDLNARCKTGEFREDLYHRLNVFDIITPTLDEHSEDILCLVRHFLRKVQKVEPFAAVSIDENAADFLARQSWPGNVRQLENTIIKAAILARSSSITLQLVQQICTSNPLVGGPVLIRRGPLTDLLGKAQSGEIRGLHKLVIDQADSSLLNRAMSFARGNQSKVARWLGQTRRTIRRKLQKYKISGTWDKGSSAKRSKMFRRGARPRDDTLL